MRTTDPAFIEELTSRLIEDNAAYIAIDKTDYKRTIDLFGEPSVAIETGNCSSASALMDSLQTELNPEDSSDVKAAIMSLTTPRENSMTMAELQEICNLVSDHFGRNVRILKSLSFCGKERNRAVIILWK